MKKPFIFAALTERKTNLSSIFPFFKEIATYCEQFDVTFYVFSIENWKDDNVIGHVYKNDQWSQKEMPHPHVIYNRLSSRKIEMSETTKSFFNLLQSLKIPHFNERFLNKWEIYEALSEHSYMIPYLPQTKLMDGKAVLKDMLKTHPTVFIKPIHGSQGRNIYRIKKISNETLQFDYSTLTQEIQNCFYNIDSLYHSLRERLLKQRFIIQEGIHILLLNDRPIDFRYLCHRNSLHEWILTSVVARISDENKFVSNIAQGGEIYSLNEILDISFPTNNQSHIKNTLKELALESCYIIGKKFPGYYGELGVDITLDSTLHPWILEINSKPSKSDDDTKNKKPIRPSAKRIVDYAIALSRINE